jgi:hypothetical protein
MAVPTGTFRSFEMVGVREDLSDVIYDISPVETPFLNLVPHVEASNTLHEWQTDSLAAAANNAALSGDDAPKNSATATVRRNNRTQISTKDARVSGTGRNIDAAGRADELDYQMLKKGRELRRDKEVALLSNKAKVTAGAAVAGELAGVPSWIATNTDAIGADPTGDGSNAATDGAQRAFTEDQLKDVLRQVFNEGGSPDVLMVGPFNRQVASSFSAGRTNVQKAEDSTLHATFDVYQSDFGTLRIIPNRHMRARDALVLQADMWAVAFLPGRNMAVWDLAKTGDSDARQILSEYTLEARNEKANGIIRDLTTS